MKYLGFFYLTNETYSWVLPLLVIIIATFFIKYGLLLILKHATKIANHTKTIWDDAFLKSVEKPIMLALWLISISFIIEIFKNQLNNFFSNYLQTFREIIVIFCITLFLVRFIGQVGEAIILRRTQQDEDLDQTTIDALIKLARLIVIITAILIIAQNLGIQIGGLLALGGMGGLAVGLAAKDLLANFFGGLTIYLDRPFGVGDWIRSPDKSIEGTVEYISWRHTRIRAFNKNPIYVPNSVFTTIVVENPTRMSHRRIKETIGLRYSDFSQIKIIINDINKMLINHEGIDSDQTCIVNFNLYGEFSLDIMIYTFTKTTDWVHYHKIKQDVLLQIGEIIKTNKAEIAFPTQMIHLEKNN